ncbi:PPOX class F420-dependent oxidoreductase [Pseudonocardia sp. KRD291]|uniref:PPOX class F420-dependent oxidoreductase n=1 Tax=Pseudonocardia sp. KRD291 TaxID=2792007 RepID=UPI001C4A3C89|nr:PPOX class F420-dependent oxidoreductase [Pseudonocardia sp. KRD291]MBW0103369.1 PPOX class F420-dependent oxidoreductase [Pseudonocardia sp. KRD291]
MSDTATLTSEVVDFLTSGTRTGMLGFVAKDGRPLVAPVWFLVEDGELVFNTGADTAKGRAIARDPRIVLTADLPEPPFGFVQVQGEARTSTDPGELLRTATALGGRYMGAELAEEFGRRNGVPGELVVRIRPTKVTAHLDMTA